MRESEYRKQLLIQQIADHRQIMQLEIKALKDANPVTPVVEAGKQALGLLGAINPKLRSRTDSLGAALRSHAAPGLLTATAPVILQVMKAVLDRRERQLGATADGFPDDRQLPYLAVPGNRATGNG